MARSGVRADNGSSEGRGMSTRKLFSVALCLVLEIGSCSRSAFASWWQLLRLRFCSRFLRALFQFCKRAAGEATKFGRSGVELLGVVGVARLECDEPAAEAGELIGRQLGDSFGDFFDFHVAQYSTDGAFWLSGGRIKLPHA
jgi:hypothetical protein